MKKKTKQIAEDNRGVAIYARKSRITNKGDSIGVQFKQCAEYATRELSLDDDYTFINYEDKGLSGYYSDRPDFQRMFHDIEMGKIRAVVCYKLDRIGRKTADLLRLLDFLEKHKVDLLICSNNINTASGVSKIFIQIFAVVAEFERDTLTERITDNMMELAKDGRWLGGNTPTGFSVKRVTTGSGKNKSAYSYLESIPEEKAMIQKLYEIFGQLRSIKKTADKMNKLGYRTKAGSKFNASTTRLLLKNPVYCVADENVYNYFYENGGGLCEELSAFDGQHGLSAYNKTDQEKFEDADSTFISPKFVQIMSAKPVSEWIISVDRHEGFIPSQQWIDTQNMLDDIAEKYNRPHRKTNALLSGLVYCPLCGKRLRVISESNRWTNGKPRFKYVCPGYRENECTFQAVDGVLLDEFVVQQLSNLSAEDSEYFTALLNQRTSDIFKNSQNEQELTELKKKKAQLETTISNQVKNMRDASDDLKRFIQEDIQDLSDELREVGILLEKLEDSKRNQMYAVRNIEEIKERLLSFGKYAEDSQPDVLVRLIQSFVERIYIVDENDERYCHIFIKGCTKEDYDEFFRATGYISGAGENGIITSKLPLCDSDECCKSNFRSDNKSFQKFNRKSLLMVLYFFDEKRRSLFMNPTVSIIVPVYNAEKYLNRCVDSILNQEYTDFELILVNDGSKDSSGLICDEYAVRDSRVRVIHKENSGVSATRNLAIDNACGTYLQFLDSDDWITPDATKLLVRAAEEYHCDLVIADFYRVVGERLAQKGDIEEDGVMTLEEFAAHMMENPADFYYGVLWNKLFRRDIIEQHKLRMNTDISWCEDFMFNLEYIRHANVFYALQVPIYYYVKTKGSLASQGMSISNTVKMKLMVFEYYNNFYKHVFDESDYETNRLQVYRYFVDAAGDGFVLPSLLPGTHKLGNERVSVSPDSITNPGILMDAYRERKLLERQLETVALKNSLTLNDVMILLYLMQSPEPVTQRDLAEYTGIGLSALLISLGKLVSRELLRFKSGKPAGKISPTAISFTDRAMEFVILPLCEPVLNDIVTAVSDYDMIRFCGFSEEQLRSYTGLSKQIRQNIQGQLK